MLKQASKNCRHFKNVTFQKSDITKLEVTDASFDKVVAGNVIHLLPEPETALSELKRITKRAEQSSSLPTSTCQKEAEQLP